jgi:subtilase family serine protease
MTRTWRLLLVCFGLMLAAGMSYQRRVSAGGGPRVLITHKINEAALVRLAGNTRPEANAANDRGPVRDSFPLKHMLLQLRRSPEQEQAFENYSKEVQDPGSPNYHHWLTAREIGQRYGLAAQDLATITDWLKSHGFTVNRVYPNGVVIDFSGTAGQVREAFHTEIHHLEVGGKMHIANMSDPEIPAALAPAIVGVVSLNNFMPHPMLRRRSEYSAGGGYYLLVPADLATIYNLNPLFSAGYTGQGRTIVVVEDSDVYTTNDWSTFRSTFGLAGAYPHGSFTQVHPQPGTGGNCADPGVNGDDGEAILDAEWASAAAPDAAIVLASCADTTNFGGFIALQNILSDGGSIPDVVSISYGEAESELGAAVNAYISGLYQQAATQGVSVFVSSGDEGAATSDYGASYATHGINVNGFASTPYDVAVGGTDFGDAYAGTTSTYWSSTNGPDYGSARSYIPEIPWNNTCGSALIAKYLGFSTTYGSSGLCNSSDASYYGLLSIVGGSGGPSGCATGAPSVSKVVSGTCAGYPKPSWQSVFGNPNDGVRDIPDVSLFAASGAWNHYYVVCYSDTANGGTPCIGAPAYWSGFGGTSVSSPIMAAIQALADQQAGARQGNPNPVYYSLAAQEYGTGGSSSCNSSLGNAAGSSCIFYDVTQGDMDVPCEGSHNCYLPSGTYGVLSTSNSAYQPAYAATTGWDFATGIGTVNAYNLVMAFATAMPTPTPTSTATPTATPTATYTATPTATATSTATPTATATPTPGGKLRGVPGKVHFHATGIGVLPAPTKTFTIRNGSRDQTLTVTVGALSPPFTVSNPGTFSLEAHGIRPETITFQPIAVGTATALPALAITSSDPKHLSRQVQVSGTGAGGKLYVHKTLSFPKTAMGSLASKNLVLKNAGKGMLSGSVGSLAPPFDVTPGPFGPLAPHAEATVTVTFSPQTTGAAVPRTLTINVDSPSTPATATVTVKGKGK